MKRFLFIATCTTAFAWASCSGNKQQQATEDIIPKGMRGVDLGLHHDSLGFPLKINVPDSTFYPTVDVKPATTGLEVAVGTHFDVLINTATAEDADLNQQKTLIGSADAGTSTFSTTDSATLAWETKFGDLSMFHFYHLVKIGKATYYVRDNNSDPSAQITKADIDKMLESAKSLRARPAAAPKSE